MSITYKPVIIEEWSEKLAPFIKEVQDNPSLASHEALIRKWETLWTEGYDHGGINCLAKIFGQEVMKSVRTLQAEWPINKNR